MVRQGDCVWVRQSLRNEMRKIIRVNHKKTWRVGNLAEKTRFRGGKVAKWNVAILQNCHDEKGRAGGRRRARPVSWARPSRKTDQTLTHFMQLLIPNISSHDMTKRLWTA
jgi:hypothetical protein